MRGHAVVAEQRLVARLRLRGDLVVLPPVHARDAAKQLREEERGRTHMPAGGLATSFADWNIAALGRRQPI